MKLGEVCSLSKGEQINGTELSDSYDVPFLNGGIDPSGKWKDANVSANSIAISEGGNSCGYVNYMPTPFWCGAHCYYLYDVKCDTKYLYHALKSRQKKIMALRTGVCMPNIKKSSIIDFEIPFHDTLPTQRKIAAELDLICELKRKAEEVVEKFGQLVKSKFVEMFGDVWQEDGKLPLGSICDFITVGIANSATHAYADDGVVLLRNQNIRENRLDEADIAHITKQFADKYKSKALNEGDLIITRTGYPGVACVVPRKYAGCQTFTTLILRLADKTKTLPVFVSYFINSQYGKEYVDANKVGVAQQNFGATALSSMPIIIPPLPLQREFAAFVARVEKLEAAAKARVEKFDLLYRAKLQEYFA